MKKWLVFGIVVIFAALAASPAMPEMGRGGMGPGGTGSGQGSWAAPNRLDDKTTQEVNQAWQGHYKDTADLRQKIWTKQHEIATLLSNPKTSKESLLAQQAELQKLINDLQRQQLAFRWDFYQKHPQLAPDAYGGAFGLGMCIEGGPDTMGPGMMGYGYGAGMMGYGSGYGYGPGKMGYGSGAGYGPGMMGYGSGYGYGSGQGMMGPGGYNYNR